MQPNLRHRIWQIRGILLTASCVAGVVILGSWVGLFQLLEWATLDQWFRLRRPEATDTRIVIVTIDEPDIAKLGQWPISDAILAQLIKKISEQGPIGIGLDLYRNLPVEPGHQDLVKVFQTTPNLIGVEKAIGNVVEPPPGLRKLDQVALADLVLDADGKVRRGLISTQNKDGVTKLSLGVKLALMYLEKQGIALEPVSSSFLWWHSQEQKRRLGRAIFEPFMSNDGGYVRADSGGYQILLNFRGQEDKFESVSITEILDDKVPANLMRDRLVLIGSTGQSLKDLFYTPYSSSVLQTPQTTAGVVIHANLTSSILSAALEGRPLLRVWSDPLEYIWLAIWSVIGAALTWQLLEVNPLRRNFSYLLSCLVLGITVAGGCLLGIAYLAFINGWWIPVIPALIALTGSTIVIGGEKTQDFQRLASLDGLTQVANRRYFDQYLQREWWRRVSSKEYISLILCDVDYFKPYNDTYGHQAGDLCLQQVAQVLRQGVRTTDLVARYGGEEFVIVLPNTDAETAMQIAERICVQLKTLHIPHTNSQVSPYVTLSCGVSSVIPSAELQAETLIHLADEALYEAKDKGRDRVILKI